MAASYLARDFLYIVLAASSEAYVIKAATPDYVLHQRISRAIAYLFIPNFLLYYGYKCFIYPFFISPFRNLPQPKGNILYGNAIAQFSKPNGNEFKKWMQNIPNDGLIAFRSFGNDWRLLPTSPATIKQVLSDHAYDWQKPSPVVGFLVEIIGLGLILAEGSVHKFQRKNLLSSFQFSVIRDLHPLFWGKGVEMVEAIQRQHIDDQAEDKKGRIEFNDWTTRVTLDIIGVAGFGKDFDSLNNAKDELVQHYEELLEPDTANAIFFAANILLPGFLVRLLPIAQNAKMNKITGVLADFAVGLARSRREQAEGKGLREDQKDILSMIVRGGQFKDKEVADQVLTMLAAGHETTSSAMTWVAYLLAVNPDMQERLREEIRATIPNINEPITQSIIDSMPYLNAVCNETLRLYPTVPVTIRECVRETVLDGYPVRKGTTLMLVPWAINRSKQLWGEDSEKFDPERWMKPGTANTGGAGSNYAVITFLHGPRSCIGQGFARQELKCLTAAFFGRYKVELDMKDSDIYPAGVVTTKPKNGMHLKLTPQSGW